MLLQTTVNWDINIGNIIQMLTPILLAVIGYYARKDAIAKGEKLDGIHTLVNDQMTTEKKNRLADLKAQKVVIERLMGLADDLTDDHRLMLIAIDVQIEALVEEIRNRDEQAEDISGYPTRIIKK